MASSDSLRKRPGEINEWNMNCKFFLGFTDSALREHNVHRRLNMLHELHVPLGLSRISLFTTITLFR